MLGTVAHACSLSYLGSRGRRVSSAQESGPAWVIRQDPEKGRGKVGGRETRKRRKERHRLEKNIPNIRF